ncbi:STAS domain-containing protein [Prosthecobacter fluviatilis]|uniref:Anti-sigma factor antagonist n=1 Tax=Prosthecobacter fluviatilis TaxID=445931 RepID=A0ABW0KK48_9BACT
MTLSASVQINAPTELCAATARLWRDRLDRDIKPEHEDISIDLSKTRFIDSSGLGVLLTLNKSLRARGASLKLLNPSSAVCQLIELTRLHRVFEMIHD